MGALATITFQALLTGTAPISFTEVILADSEGEAIPAEVQNGRVIITDWERVFLPLVLRG